MLGWSSLCLVTGLLVSCANQDQAEQQPPQDAMAQQAEIALQNPQPQAFPSPDILAPSSLPSTVSKPSLADKPAPIATIPVKGLQKPTSPEERVALAKTGMTRDPFAPLLPTQIEFAPLPKQSSVPTKSSAPQPASQNQASQTQRSRTNQPKPSTIAPLPNISFKPLPPAPVPNFAPPIAVNPLPPMQVPIAPTLSPTHLAEAVEITGIVQMGDRTLVIAKAPDEATARYIQTGDYLSGGQVQLKAIRMSPQGEPTVILRQAGQDVTKSLGRQQASGLNSSRMGLSRLELFK
ncbi:MAG: hypothetical protein VKJ24_10280 [Synechococcales bacterium]|nr:hypothetical protein [Synechococcales bacterium]